MIQGRDLGDETDDREPFRVGDVVSFAAHWSVPSELVGKFFRVEAGEGGAWKLSRPYEDAACTRPYHALPPGYGMGS